MILAIDPGSEQSAIVFWDGETETIHEMGIFPNETLVKELPGRHHVGRSLVIEEIRSYGMPVGLSIFQTVFWSGRFAQAWRGDFNMLPRGKVKMHLCHTMRAKDSNIRQTLIDRFGVPGTKKKPGLTYGLKKDLWAAFALAVTFYDTEITKCDIHDLINKLYKKGGKE